MKTLYTGHISIGDHQIYSYIYAETLRDAEEHLRMLLLTYLRDHCRVSPTAHPIKVVSRPQGWEAPDGYYLPPTSKQYALKYPLHSSVGFPTEKNTFQESTRAV